MGERHRRRAAANGMRSERAVEYCGHLRRPGRDGACWHPSEWNTIERVLDSELPFVTSELLKVPEGLVSIMRCTRCGGREEECFNVFGTSDQNVERVAALVATPHRQFEEEHRACPVATAERTLPLRVAHTIDARLAAADRAIRAGRRCDAYISLLTDTKEYRIDGVSLVPGSVNGGRDRLHGIAQLQFGIRMHIAHEDIMPIGIVLVAEAWTLSWTSATEHWRAPSGDPDRTEALSISVVTPSFARHGMANITRNGGRNDGPGVLSPVIWGQLERSALVDGMLAQSGAPLRLVRDAMEATSTDSSVRSLLD